jgi:hypothetical protein
MPALSRPRVVRPPIDIRDHPRPIASGEATLQSARLIRASLLAAGLMAVSMTGCEQREVIPLAEAPRVAQPDPVPVEKLPKKDRPRVDASARAALRFDPVKQHGGPPR